MQESPVCYICLENTDPMRQCSCECKAVVHYKCLLQFCRSENTIECSICKTQIKDLQRTKKTALNCNRMAFLYFLNTAIISFSFGFLVLLFLKLHDNESKNESTSMLEFLIVDMFIIFAIMSMAHACMQGFGVYDTVFTSYWSVSIALSNSCDKRTKVGIAPAVQESSL